MRDGVTGNTPGFELENEGSTPSPAANSSNVQGPTSNVQSVGLVLFVALVERSRYRSWFFNGFTNLSFSTRD